MGGKRGSLTDVSFYLQISRHYGTLPWASREERTVYQPYQKHQTEQNQNLSFLPRGGYLSPILSSG